MKKKFTYLFSLFALVLMSCEKPSPVELDEGQSYQSDPLEVEVLAQNPVEDLYSSDPDSGLIMSAPPDPRFGSQVIITRSKTSEGNVTREVTLGEAVFYDLNAPVVNEYGKTVAFKTRAVQLVKFKLALAREIPFHFRYLTRNGVVDSLLGPKFLVMRRNNILGDLFQFDYGSETEVEIKKFGAPIEHYTVATPAEITGEVTKGTRPNGLEILTATWNPENSFSVHIVLSGVAVQTLHIVPLFRITTRDDGNLIIPANLLASIPAARFNKLIVTFVRQSESLNESTDEKLLFRTQSVHNRVIDLN